MLISVLIPSRSGRFFGPETIWIRTGMRCTTFTQLPEEFCAGRMENSEPLAGLRLCTTPCQVWPG